MRSKHEIIISFYGGTSQQILTTQNKKGTVLENTFQHHGKWQMQPHSLAKEEAIEATTLTTLPKPCTDSQE